MAEDVKVPEGWRRVRLGEISEIVKGITYKSSDYCESEEGATFINLKCILKKGGFNKDGLKYFKGLIRESQILRKGDIIIAIVDLTRDGDIIGYPLRVPDFGSNKVVTMSMDVVKIEPDAQIDKAFLYYRLCLNDIHSYILSISAGSTVLHLDLNWLPQLEFSVPLSLPEQHKIAEILETVDNAIEKTDAIIEKYKRIKQGLMQDLLTRGIAESDELGVRSYELRDEKKHRFKDSPLGRIPEEWKVVELGEVADVRGGKRLPKGEDFAASQTLFPYIRLVDIKGMNINLSAVKYIQEKTWKRIRRYTISKDDIMLSIAGTIGLVALIPEALDGANLTENAAKLTTLRYFDKRFLAYYLTFHKAQRQIETLMGIVAQPKLALFRIKQLKIPLPPLPEQHRIASILSQIDEAIEKEQKYKEKLERIKRGLMEDLLTGKVRVLGVMNYELGVKS